MLNKSDDSLYVSYGGVNTLFSMRLNGVSSVKMTYFSVQLCKRGSVNQLTFVLLPTVQSAGLSKLAHARWLDASLES